jgi:hypothetical protein
MPRTLQQEWPAATFEHASVWSKGIHRGQGDALQRIEAIPRTFAEFPFTKSWQEITIHAQRLLGVSRVGLFGKGSESWLRFTYMGETFSVQDGNNRLTLVVDDADCPDTILLAVQSHFAPFLSAHLCD